MMRRVLLFITCSFGLMPALLAQKADPALYCNSRATTNAVERVNAFTLKEITYSNTTTCTTYNDLTTKAAGIAPGEIVTGTLQLGACSGTMVSSAAKIFIDWNGDKDFADANETVYTTPSAVTVATNFAISFTVPANVTPGLTTVMRVVNQYNTTPANIQPCGTFLRGETQDYTVQITLFSESTLSTFSSLSINYMKAGDYDNDGDMDLLVKEATTPSVRLYRNTTTIPGTPAFVNSGLVFPSNIEMDGWLDYNNDGFIDMMTHVNNGVATVYLSNGGTSFTATATSFGSAISSVDWADYDRDGDMDYLVAVTGNSPAKIFRQMTDKTFADGGSVQNGKYFVDYDNDNDFDITNGRYIYTNVENNFEQTHNLFPNNEATNTTTPVFNDLDGDGDMDGMVIWNRIETGSAELTSLINNGGVFTTGHVIAAYDPGQLLEPYDFDNNGKPEIIAIGAYTLSGPPRVYYGIYEVTNGILTDKYKMPLITDGLDSKGAVAGDFDKDGYMDFITYGYNTTTGLYYTRFYRNRISTANTAPSVPANLVSKINDGHVKLSWSESTDDKTPALSLSYNIEIRVGTDTLKSALSRKSGPRKVLIKGNTSLNNEFDLSAADLPQGLYSWSVQAIDQHQRASAFAAEGTFELINQNYPLTKITNGTVIKSIYNAVAHEYIVAYIQSGDVFYQRLDLRGQKNGQAIKLNQISTGLTDFELTAGLDDAEYLIVWNASNGTYAKRIVTGTTANELLISDQASFIYLGVAAVYNPTNREYAGFFSHYTYTSSSLSYLKGIQLIPSGGFLLTKGTLKTLSTITNPNYPQSHEDIAVQFNKAFNCYVLSWFDNVNTTIFNFAYNMNPNFVRFQLFSPTITPYAAPVTIGFDYGMTLGLKEQFQNKYLAIWTEANQYASTGSGSNAYDFTYETRGTILELSAGPTAPVITLKPISFNLSASSNQGTLYTGSSGPSHIFNTKRNEHFMMWRNDNNAYIKFQRYDVVDSKLVLNDELRINDYKGGKTNVSFNADRNIFMVAWVDGTDSYYTQFTPEKDDLPVVTSVDKPKAYAGEKVVVTGDLFSKTNSLNTVKFGGTVATITNTYTDGKHLEVIVPDGLGRTPIPISITFDDQEGFSTFLFENLTLPTISSVDVTEGEVGAIVTITGDKFAEDSTQFIIKFNGVPAAFNEIVSSTTTKIKVKVPAAAVRGTGPLTITIQGQEVAAPLNFHVIIPPVITSLEAPEGFISCKTITIRGTGFSNTNTNLTVMFGSVAATPEDFLATALTAIVLRVPIGAEGNVPVTVTIDGRTAATANQQVYLGSAVDSYKNPGKIELTNHTTDAVDIQVKVKNQCSVEEVKLWKKGISDEDAAWTGAVLTGLSDNRIDVSIAEDQFKNDPIGLSLFYEVHDQSGKLTRSDTFNIYKQFTEFDSANFVPSLVFGGSRDDYNIVSIPYDMTPNKVTSVFKDIFNTYGYDSTKWRIFHYLNDGTKEKYVEYLRGLNEIELGKSYWIIIRYKQDIFFEGAQSVDLSEGPFSITLYPGWNQIGNPYNFNVSWQDIMVANGNPTSLESLKTFRDGVFQAPGVVNKFGGGFVRNNGSTPVILKIPFIRNKSINSGREKDFSADLSSDQWQFPIELRSPKLANTIARIGMHPEAKENIDRFDEHAMPHFDRYLDVTFPGNMSASIIPSGEAYTWEFSVSTNTHESELTLQWSNGELGQKDRQLFLHDLDEERIVNMREVDHYSFRYSKSRQFKIYYGSEAYLREVMSPGKNRMGDAYPNPFNNSTRIPFTVSTEKAHVRLGIYNLQGEEVGVIINQELEKGFYEPSWEGTNASGQTLPSGPYLLNLQIVGQTSHTGTQKVILIK